MIVCIFRCRTARRCWRPAGGSSGHRGAGRTRYVSEFHRWMDVKNATCEYERLHCRWFTRVTPRSILVRQKALLDDAPAPQVALCRSYVPSAAGSSVAYSLLALLLAAGLVRGRLGGDAYRVRSHRRLKNRGTNYLTAHEIKWVRGSAKRPRGQVRQTPRCAPDVDTSIGFYTTIK